MHHLEIAFVGPFFYIYVVNNHFVLIILISIAGVLKAQNFSFTNYGIEDGLPSSQIYQVTTDQKGFIWFSSDAGIGKFTMGKIKLLTMTDGIPDNTVFTLTQSGNNRLLGTCYNHNLFEVDIATHKINKVHKKLAEKLEKEKALIIQTNVLGQQAFLNTACGLSRYSLKDSNLFIVKKSAETDISIDVNGKQAFLNFNEKGYGANLENIITQKGNFLVTVNFSGRSVNYVLNERRNYLSYRNYRAMALPNGDIGLTLGTQYIILKTNGQFTTYTCKSEIVAAYQDKDKDLWLGVKNEGVYYFKNSLLDVSPEKLLPNNTVTSICNDYEGGIWLSTLENGLYYAPSKLFKQINNHTFSKAITKKIQVSDKTVYILNSRNEVYQMKIDANETCYLTDKTFVASDELNNIKIIDHHLLITGINGLSLLSEDLSKSLSFAKLGLNAREIVIDKNNVIWIESYNGLMQLTYDNLIHNKPGNPMTQSGYGLAIDNNENIIIGSFKGLFTYNNGHMSLTNEQLPLLKNRIDYIFIDAQNRYWLSINGFGLGIYYNQKVYLIKLDDTVINAKVTCMVQNGNDYWIGTKNGLCQLQLIMNGSNIIHHTAVKYDREDGLVSNEINDLKQVDNTLLIGSSKGFCYANLNQLTKDYAFNPITLRLRENTHYKAVDGQIEIENDFDKLFFDIEQPAYRHFKNIKYAYKFENDSAFVTENSASIALEKLKYGQYNLIVKNAHQDASSPVATLKFMVKKPYWLRWWFILMIAVLLSALIYFYIIIRTNNIKRLNAEKLKIDRIMNEYKMASLQAQMNPHFIFNAFSSIQQFILTNQTDDAYDYLAKFSKLIRLFLESSRDSYISLKKEINLLQLYLEVEQLRTDHKFTFQISVDVEMDVDAISIPIMLVQPHVENAIWHGISHLEGNSGLVTITIEETPTHVRFVIRDNGVGRSVAKKHNDEYNKQHRSLSTEINNERLNLFESSIEIIDEMDDDNRPSGTKVIVNIKKNDG